MDVTTVADDLAVLHDGRDVLRFTELTADTEYTLSGVVVRTLPAVPGDRCCRFATVNDVHFGELEAGRIDDLDDGPIRRREPGEEPYPELMNRAAASEIAAIGPVAVIAKGDLTATGAAHELEAFERCFREPFGERLYAVRGNHDAYHHQDVYAGDQWIELPGVTVALIDTTIPGATTGTMSAQQVEWLDDLCATADVPVFVMGHHQQWIGSGGGERDDGYFGLHPEASDALDELAARRRAVVAYAAGHTHRHRVRPMSRSGVPSIEVGCTKDFPGTWAEYRVHEGGIMQVVHRISTPEALAWSESCRGIYADFGIDYGTYALGTLSERCFIIPPR